MRLAVNVSLLLYLMINLKQMQGATLTVPKPYSTRHITFPEQDIKKGV